MRTNTQYHRDKPEVVERKVISLAEAYSMSEDKINEHFENVAKRNSYQHNIMIEAKYHSCMPSKYDGEVDYNRMIVKRIAKRYRKPGRC